MLLTLDKLLEAARESRQRSRAVAERRLAAGVLAALAEGEPVTPKRIESLGREAGLAGVELATAIAGIRESSSLGADGSVRAFMELSLDRRRGSQPGARRAWLRLPKRQHWGVPGLSW